MNTAPQGRAPILARTKKLDAAQWQNLSERWFVVFHLGRTENDDLDMGWAMFPGMGVSADWFEGWIPLPGHDVERELLAELKFAVKLLSAFPAINGTAQVERMRAVIAKAEGQSPVQEGK